MASDGEDRFGPAGSEERDGPERRPGGRRRRRGRGPGAAAPEQERAGGTRPDTVGQPPGTGAQPPTPPRTRGPREPGGARQGADGPERTGGSGRRPPLPQQPTRRPRRDEEAPERLQPTRARHAPAAPQPGRGEQTGAGRRGEQASGGRQSGDGRETAPGDRSRQGGRRGGEQTGRGQGQGSPRDRAAGGERGPRGRASEGERGQERRPARQGSGEAGGRGGRPGRGAVGDAVGRADGDRGSVLAGNGRAGAGGERAGSGATAGAGPRGRLRVIPLGGVGEVGKNMTAVEYERDVILLDCGGKFPEEEQRGIDLIVPDVRWVRDRLPNLRGLVITHGHEDHIGGLPYVLPLLGIEKRSPLPVYGSPLAIGFIERKLAEARLDELVDLRVVQPGDRVQLGQLAVTFVHVTHSIPDTNAVAVHSPVGTILDTADFKFDPTPVMGGPTDERLLRRLGDQGILALFSDTVRVETAGSTPSERVVLETMDQVIREAKGQVIVTTFASNISRIHMALLAAEKYGRKVAVAGRSMEQNARVAVDLGYLEPPEGLLLPLDEVLKAPRNKRVLVITGSQGEPAAALARIAAAEHPKIRVGAGDVVLVSATPIPGNEETVTNTIDNLFRRGTRVIYSALERGVHVSGHAGRDELRKMIDLLRPRYTVPIHGEYRHMVLYRELCGDAGIPPERVLLPEIGGVLEFTADSAAHRGRVPAGSILVDRLGDRGAGQVTLRDREHLADDGVVVVTIVVNRENGQLIAGPDLVARGLRPELQNGALREAEAELRRTMERRSKGEPQYGYMVQRAKEIVGRVLYRRSKSRPMILPMVTEL